MRGCEVNPRVAPRAGLAAKSAVLFVAAALILAPGAAAHTIGSGALTSRGSFELPPLGTPRNLFHAFLSTLGVPIRAGDTLDFDWFANNGSGPAVLFDLHSHVGGHVKFYETEGASDHGTWLVPRNDDTIMALWENPSAERVNVSYAFEVRRPDPRGRGHRRPARDRRVLEVLPGDSGLRPWPVPRAAGGAVMRVRPEGAFHTAMIAGLVVRSARVSVATPAEARAWRIEMKISRTDGFDVRPTFHVRLAGG